MDKDIADHFLHKEFPKTKDAGDFWGQVSRTVKGKPVSQNNIDIIIRAIEESLCFSPEDELLDIGCGNGALSQYFFNKIARFLGVDFSEFLIQVAKSNFEILPHFQFIESDAVSYAYNESNPERFTKALCYGAFTYLPKKDAKTLLALLNKRFINVSILYIGNLPDTQKAHLFYNQETDYEHLLSDPLAKIGIWRSQDEMRALANETGWNAEFIKMPDRFYSAHYRYDVKLTKVQ